MVNPESTLIVNPNQKGIMRTQEEITEKIEALKNEDWMGTIRTDLLSFLKFDKAQSQLKDGVTEAEWLDGGFIENTEENIKKEMQNYLDFAFGKAENERGISAGRSMDHYYAWIWLLDKEDHFGNVREYSAYGISHLRKIESFLKE